MCLTARVAQDELHDSRLSRAFRIVRSIEFPALKSCRGITCSLGIVEEKKASHSAWYWRGVHRKETQHDEIVQVYDPIRGKLVLSRPVKPYFAKRTYLLLNNNLEIA